MGPLSNIPEYTVSALSQALKLTLERGFAHIRLNGEISNYKRHTSGHHYFTLKDMDACIDAVCWRGTAVQLPTPIQDGMSVVCTGRVTTYPGRSKYQIVVESMELAGVGALLQRIENLKKQLASEGLFAESRKRPLPFLPKRIGIITSPTGAVINDMLHRLEDRFPCAITLWPTAVQGDEAPQQMIQAFIGFTNMPTDHPLRPDLLIIARGGGSLEDMMAFNNEGVIRAAASCPIPFISAIGHETDWCILDLIADYRAPTPTAAAEKAVPVRQQLIYDIQTLKHRMDQTWQRFIQQTKNHLHTISRSLQPAKHTFDHASQKLDERTDRFQNAATAWAEKLKNRVDGLGQRLISPKVYIRQLEANLSHGWQRAGSAMGYRWLQTQQRFEQCTESMQRCLHHFMVTTTQRLNPLTQILEMLSYQKTLDRGFCLAFKPSTRQMVTSAITAKSQDALTIQFADGECDVVVPAPIDGVPPNQLTHPSRADKTKKSVISTQSSLFDTTPTSNR